MFELTEQILLTTQQFKDIFRVRGRLKKWENGFYINGQAGELVSVSWPAFHFLLNEKKSCLSERLLMKMKSGFTKIVWSVENYVKIKDRLQHQQKNLTYLVKNCSVYGGTWNLYCIRNYWKMVKLLVQSITLVSFEILSLQLKYKCYSQDKETRKLHCCMTMDIHPLLCWPK